MTVEIDYTNHRGARAWRRIKVRSFFFGTSKPWHLEPQWLMTAVDLDRQVERTFAMSNVHDVRPHDAVFTVSETTDEKGEVRR